MTAPFARAIRSVSVADWMTVARARAYVTILAVVTGLVIGGYLLLSSGVHDPLGKALGTDFASFWTASKLALGGDAAGPWNVTAHQAEQARMFGADAGYAAFFYPPTYLLVCLPLALAPYAVSLAVWIAGTLALWARMVRAWAGDALGWLPILAFPAVIMNAGHGQNGFLTAALFGAGALLADKRPWLSGVLFGALIIKPHLAVLVPLFFIFTGNWRGFVAAGCTALGLCLASLVVLGPEAWRGFLETSALARATLEQDLVGYAKMQSAYAGARLMGADSAIAWGVQALSALGAVFLLWRTRKTDGAARGAMLCCATLLTTPFLLDYDLTLLAVPLAWLFREVVRAGTRDWDKAALGLGYLLPLVARPIATGLGAPLSPLLIAALAVCVLRRVAPSRDAAPASLAPLASTR